MKIVALSITILLSLLTLNGFASGNGEEKKQLNKQVVKYDFNIFRLFTIHVHNDSTSLDTTRTKPILNTSVRRKEND